MSLLSVGYCVRLPSSSLLHVVTRAAVSRPACVAGCRRPTNGIQKTPYQLWIQQAINASYNVVHAPLSAAAAKMFNNSAAMDFFATVEGLDYGYHNMLWWVRRRSFGCGAVIAVSLAVSGCTVAGAGWTP